MPDEILSLGIDARPAEEGGRRYARTIDEVTGANTRADNSTSKLEERFRSLSRTTAEGTKSIAGWVLQHSILLGSIGLVTRALAGLSSGAMAVFLGTTGKVADALSNATSYAALFVAKGLRGIASVATDTSASLGGFAAALTTGSVWMERWGALTLKLSVGVLAVGSAAAAAGVALTGAAVAAGNHFIPAWNRVLTLAKGTPAELENLRNELESLASSLGVDQTEAATQYYEVLSALPEAIDNPVAGLKVLEAALKASKTGFTTTADAISAITGILYNYSLSADHAGEVADALFKAQDLGSITFGEVASSISTAAPLVASLGGSYQDLLAITALVSRGQTSTSEAMTQVTAALSALIQNTDASRKASKELGIQFDAASVQAKGLAGFLLDIIDKTDGHPEVLAKFFGRREAITLLISLAQRTEELRRVVEETADSAGGADRIYRQMNEDLGKQAALLVGPYKKGLVDAGVEIDRNAIRMLKWANAAKDFLLDPRIQKAMGDASAIMMGQPFNPFQRPPAAPVTVPTLNPVRVIGRPRAAPEATTVDYSTEKIQDLQNALRASAVAALASSGDFRAYDKAVAAADVSVNKLVVSEMARLRAAGVAGSEVNKLAALYVDTYQKAREAAVKHLRELEDTRKEMERLTAATQTYRSVVATPLSAPTSGGIALTEDARDRYFADTQAKATAEPNMVLHAISVAQPAAPRVGFFDRARSAAGQFAGGDLKGGLGTLGVGLGTLAIAAAALAPVFKGLKDVLEPVLSKLAHPLEVMGRILGDVVTPVLELLQGPLEAVATLFSVLAQPLKLSAEIITAFVAPGLNLLGKVLKAITGGLSYIIEGIGYVVKGLGELVDKLVPDFISHAGKGLAKTGQEIIDGAERARHGFDAVATASDKLAASLSTDLPRAILSALYRARIGAPAGGGTVGGGAVGGGGPVAGGPIGGGYHPPVYTPGNHPQPAPGGVVISIGQYHSAANETPEDAARKMAKGAQILNSRGEKLYAPGLVVAA